MSRWRGQDHSPAFPSFGVSGPKDFVAELSQEHAEQHCAAVWQRRVDGSLLDVLPLVACK
jgi:hypothetical protein